MAGNIKGITLEINGDTTKLQDALRGVDKSLKDTQSQLKDVNKLLKMDPGNTELLRQKQELLGKAIKETKDKLETEKEALKQLEASGATDPAAIAQQDALKREIIATEQSLKGYEKQLKNMHGMLDQVAASSAKVAEKTKAMSAAAAGFGAAMLGNAYKAAQSADEYNTLSKQTGFTVEELQKMQYASDLVDVSMDTMTGSVQKLTKNMASGSDAFGKLGISVKDEMTGELRDANTVWYETLYALSKVENETERDALAMQLFGKSAADLSGIVDDGGVALISYGKEAEDLGLILSQDGVDAANEFNDAIATLKARASQAFLEAGAALADTLVPALEKLVEVITGVLVWFSELDGTTQTVILAILGLVAAISPLASIISAIATLIPVVTAAFTVLMGPVGAVIAIIAALVAAGVALYQNWDTVKAKASELWENIKSTFDNIKQHVVDAVEKIKSAFNFQWKLPDIKLPHFKVTGGKAPWGFMGQGSLPSISIDWYKKAYKDAVMFNSPTVLATNSGLMGFGDGKGAETVVGNELLAKLIRANSGADELSRIELLLEAIAKEGTSVTLQGDARQMFKVVRKQNANFKTATGKSGFDY